jgi:hypothetical protein
MPNLASSTILLEICTYYIMAPNEGPPRFLFCRIDPRAPKCMTYINAASKLLINVLYKYIPTTTKTSLHMLPCRIKQPWNPLTTCLQTFITYLPSRLSIELKLKLRETTEVKWLHAGSVTECEIKILLSNPLIVHATKAHQPHEYPMKLS